MKLPTVAEYLVDRLADLGVTEFFGVPGDFNFNICTAIEASDKARWIGCCNELNAGYAADGYARVKGAGAVVTTFGVGELSAINAVAGAYAERVPLFKIVGSPATSLQKGQALIHHTLGNGDFGVFENMYAAITATHTRLTAQNAAVEIERAIGIAMTEKRPVYINIPADVCNHSIAGYVPLYGRPAPEPLAIREAVAEIKQLLDRAVRPVIVADAKVMRFGLQEELQAFIERSNLPATTLVMGKGVIDGPHPNFIGTYNGKLINPETSRIVENADLLIAFGCLLTDTNSAAFTVKYDPSRTVSIHEDHVKVRRARYENVPMKDLLASLTAAVEPSTRPIPKAGPADGVPPGDPSAKLFVDHIYGRMQTFLKSGDIMVAETGSTMEGLQDIRLPSGVEFHNQGLWMSIGYATPAAFGAALAAPDRRVVLMTGDGSHQLTAQEISSMLRYGIKPIIILLNNDGYMIERYLCEEPMDTFNDIAPWNYAKLPEAFGATDAFVAQARTVGEFDKALEDAAASNKFAYIEAFTDIMDAPKVMRDIRNHRQTFYGEKGSEETGKLGRPGTPSAVAACPG